MNQTLEMNLNRVVAYLKMLALVRRYFHCG